MKSVHEVVLRAAKEVVKNKVIEEFSPREIVDHIKKNYRYPITESSIRRHVTSRCCKNAKKHYHTTSDYFEKVGHGKYVIIPLPLT